MNSFLRKPPMVSYRCNTEVYEKYGTLAIVSRA